MCIRDRYIIWDNFGLAKEDTDMAAYQLSAAVLSRLGITNGIFNAYHQFCQEENNYWSCLLYTSSPEHPSGEEPI